MESSVDSVGEQPGPFATIREQLQDPKHRERFGWLLLGLLSLLTLQLRRFLDIDGITDVDVLNFGLAAWDFDLAAWQPHPPGYPGYVLLLKAVHLVAPWLDPVGVAKWTSWLTSTATVPAAWWACRSILRLTSGPEDPSQPFLKPLWRPLAAAALAVLHPMLWYYGADGQSHASEALATLLLIGAAVRLKKRSPRWSILAFAVALGLAGALRPTVALLNGPLLLWLLWGRSWRIWVGSVVAGALGVLAWSVPLVMLAGGWSSYLRQSDALVGKVFLGNFSVFSSGSSWYWLSVQFDRFILGVILSTLPLLAWARSRECASGGIRWRLILLSVMGFNALFYGVTFVGELGYFVAMAAVSILVAATWPERQGGGLSLRAGATLVAMSFFLLLGPAEVRTVFSRGKMELPTLARLLRYERILGRYQRDVCRWSGPGGLVIVTDSEVLTHTRYLAYRCQDTLAAIHIYRPPFQRDMDAWLLYSARTLRSAPTDVPLESGPPTTIRLPRPVRYVLVSHCARPAFREAIQAQALCPPLFGDQGSQTWPDHPLVWDARCLPVIARGAHRVEILTTESRISRMERWRFHDGP